MNLRIDYKMSYAFDLEAKPDPARDDWISEFVDLPLKGDSDPLAMQFAKARQPKALAIQIYKVDDPPENALDRFVTVKQA